MLLETVLRYYIVCQLLFPVLLIVLKYLCHAIVSAACSAAVAFVSSSSVVLHCFAGSL